MQITKQLISSVNVTIDNNDIQNIYRVGNKREGAERPLLITLSSYWKKVEILKSKKNLKDVYISEDYPKIVLEKRKLLQKQVKEEREKGNFAYIKYDKLIVKEGYANKDKRKREQSTSPETYTNPRKQTFTSADKRNTNKTNAFDILKAGSKVSSPTTSKSK